jgi:long-chain acyl-CoA synthetase
MVAMMAGAAHAISIVPTDVHVSYLPLAHMYERTIAETLISFGAAIGFYAGDILKLMDDIQTLKPTVFASVPRLFNRMYDKINQTIAQESDLKRSIFEAGFNSKKEKLKAGDGVESFFWDTVVFRKTKERLGGRVRCIFSGSAPLQSDIHDFLKMYVPTSH